MRTKAILFVLAVGIFLFASGVRAEDDATGTSSFRSPKPILNFFQATKPSGSPRAEILDRLEGKRLEFCEKHQDEIEKRLESLGKLVAGMLGKFDAIAARVKEYYETKALPSGATVSNYDDLIADIAAKKAAAQEALAAAQEGVDEFTCTSDNPKEEIGQFRTDMQAVKKALQEYRTSIKNLIVAVRSVGGVKPSPTPSTP